MRKMSRRDLWSSLVVIAALAAGIVLGSQTRPCRSQGGIKEDFDELEFRVIHRPHVTYFVDLRYALCFATRKPDYQDLVQLGCTERLVQDAKDEPPPSMAKGNRGAK